MEAGDGRGWECHSQAHAFTQVLHSFVLGKQEARAGGTSAGAELVGQLKPLPPDTFAREVVGNYDKLTYALAERGTLSRCLSGLQNEPGASSSSPRKKPSALTTAPSAPSTSCWGSSAKVRVSRAKSSRASTSLPTASALRSRARLAAASGPRMRKSLLLPARRKS